MKGGMIFLLRGALGAIVGTTVLALAFSIVTGYLLFFLMTVPLISVEATIGTVVGLACWAAAGRSRHVGSLVRAAIGTGIVYGALLALNAYQLINQADDIDLSPANLLYYGLLLLLGSFATGGVAALMCPSTRETNLPWRSPTMIELDLMSDEAERKTETERTSSQKLGAI
jgi:hypothetical protein